MRFLALSVLVISASALSCPELSGQYTTCRSQTGQDSMTNLKITQNRANGVTSYVMTSTDSETNETSTETVIANGVTVSQTQTDPETGLSLQINQTASCNGTTSVSQKTEAFFAGIKLIDLTATISKSGSALTYVISGTTAEGPLEDTVICD